MTQYIDKEAVMAEIDRLIERAKAERVLYPKTILSAKNLLLLEDYDRLKKIINKIEVKEELNKALQTKIAQKSSWSEEDSEWYMVVKESILERWKGTDNKDLIEIRDDALEWLKSLKERMKGE